MPKLGVIHYNFPGFDFEQFLAFVAERGVRYVQLQLNDVWPQDEDNPEARAKAVRQQVKAHGLKVSAFSPVNDFVQTSGDVVVYQVNRMKRAGELARILDCPVLCSEGGQPKDIAQSLWANAMYECFARCTEWLDEVGVSLAIDNHGLVTNDGDLLHALLTRLNHPRIGTNLDTMNYRWYGNDIPTCNRYYEMMAPFVKHTHLKDGFDSRANYQGAALGDGEIDLAYALKCLQNAGYDGVYCAEYEGPQREDGVGYAKCFEWMKRNVQ